METMVLPAALDTGENLKRYGSAIMKNVSILSGGNQDMATKPIQAKKKNGVVLCILMAALLFFVTAFTQNGSYLTEKVVGFVSLAVTLCMVAFADKKRIKRLFTPVSFAVFAYVLLCGISTLYARSGKFAIAEFSCVLAAFGFYIGITLYAKESAVSFRRVAAILAAACAPVGILSIDAASSNLLMRPFRALMTVMNAGYGDTGASFYARLHTIFGNPNIYGGLMAMACLLSLYLALTADTNRQRVLCGILLTVNTVSYLLAFSMGSLGVFVLACVLMLVLCPKESRMSLFLLLVQTAVVALAAGMVAARGFSDTVSGSLLPLIVLIAGCVVFCLLEVFVRARVTEAFQGKGKLMLILAAVLVVAAAAYLVAGLNVTGAYTFRETSDFTRTADLGAGEYTLAVEASAPVNVRVAYKNTNNLIQNTDTELATGTSDAPVAFAVPEDSELVFVTFSGGTPGVTIETAAYSGAVSGDLKLGYKLLPAFIADRIQDLSANGNVVQRGVYRQDALRLFATSPIIGRGLGGFENGVVSVQDYYYETKHAHNHYVEVLCNLGVLGLLAYLAVLGTAIWSFVKSRKAKPLIVMLLAGCVLQMFGQATTDVIWSVGGCLPMFFSVLALVTLYCGDSLRLKVPEKDKGTAVRAPLIAGASIFIILLGLNLFAQISMYGENLTLDTLKNCAAIDFFEANDYKLSYLLSGGDEEGVADQYAADLQKAESNSIAVPLAQYYARTGQYDAALDTLDKGSAYVRADATVWQNVFTIYEAMIDPVGQMGAIPLLQDKAQYVDRMKVTYEKLRALNEEQLDNLMLTAKNNTFVGKLLAVSAIEPYEMKSALSIFSNMVVDTAYTADCDVDGTPDSAQTVEGAVAWNSDGSFTAQADSVVRLTYTIKSDGDYRLTVQSGNLSGVTEVYVGETLVALDSAGNSIALNNEIESDTENTITMRVKQGTTVDRIQYTRNSENA